MGTARIGTDPLGRCAIPTVPSTTRGAGRGRCQPLPGAGRREPHAHHHGARHPRRRKDHRHMVKAIDRPQPSADYLALVGSRAAALVTIMHRGDTPNASALTGCGVAAGRTCRRPLVCWVCAGSSRASSPPTVRTSTATTCRWRTPPVVAMEGASQRDGRREWARFTVTPVDPAAIDNRYLHALARSTTGPSHAGTGIAGPDAGLPRPRRAGLGRVAARSGVPRPGPPAFAVGWFALERLAPTGALD